MKVEFGWPNLISVVVAGARGGTLLYGPSGRGAKRLRRIPRSAGGDHRAGKRNDDKSPKALGYAEIFDYSLLYAIIVVGIRAKSWRK